MSDERIGNILDRVDDLAKEWEAGQAPHWTGTPFEQHRLEDGRFVAWFELKARDNPNWTLALAWSGNKKALVDLSRYEKIVGLRRTVQREQELNDG